MVPKPRSEEGETRPRGSSGMGQGLLSAFLPGAEPRTGSPKAKKKKKKKEFDSYLEPYFIDKIKSECVKNLNVRVKSINLRKKA